MRAGRSQNLKSRHWTGKKTSNWSQNLSTERY